MIMAPQLKRLKEYVSQQLGQLHPSLSYHNINHTMNDVLPACNYLLDKEKISVEDAVLVETAAVLHDVGYLERYTDNEIIAAERSEQMLPDFGYTLYQIEVVQSIIMATRMPQKPENHLEKIMCDADLDSLGRHDFLVLGNRLFKEHCFFLEKIQYRGWINRQIAFLESHRYFTRSARERRDEGKEANIYKLIILKQRLDRHESL